MRVSRKWWWLAVAILVVAVGAVVWVAPWKDKRPGYETAALRYGDVAQTVSASGTLNPVKVVNVGTQVSGTVKELYVDFNSRVKAGEVLLKLDPTLFQAQVAQDTASLHSAEANLLLAKANEEREQSLYREHYVAKSDLDQVTATLRIAEAQVETAKAQLVHDQANLAYTVIRSPIDGVIINRVVDVGQTVAASFQTPTLFQIGQNLKKMQIDTTVDEADIGSIKVGQRAAFTVDAFPADTFSGVVGQVRLNPTTVQNVVTYDVVIDVDNPEEKLLPGMTAYVDITVAEHHHVILVPNAALRVALAEGTPAAQSQGPGRGVIYVLKDGRPQPVPVAIGLSDSRSTEISGTGLEPGLPVITGTGPARREANRSRSVFRVRG